MLYRVIRVVAYILLRIWNRLEITGLENVPSDGKLIVVANHVSVLDPILLGVSLPRQVKFMAKKELFEVPVIGRLITVLGAFPVDRDKTDFQSVKNSLRVLANQEVLGMFPEGGTKKHAERIVFRPGAAAIALKSKSPVMPVAIVGTKSFSKVLLFGKLRVHIGSVITWPQEYEGRLQENDTILLTKEMEETVERLKNL